MTRYAVSAIFVFSNLGNLSPRKIFLINAKDAEGACLSATLKGEVEEFSFSDGAYMIHYIFLGISELVSLGDEGEDVAWSIYEEKLKI